MRRVRRHDLSPRVELLPMIDVIFLLLTFFIYSMVVLVRPQLLPVQLVPVGTGQSPEPGQVQAVTVDAAGGLHLNREPIDRAALQARLREWGELDPPPRVLVALELGAGADGPPPAGEPRPTVDRGPLLLELIEAMERAGVKDFEVVGPPRER